MKNLAIIVLVVGVLGLGGWIIYDKTKDDDATTAPSSITPSTSGETANEITGGIVVDLSGQSLTKVGPEIYNNTKTTDLILTNNLLTSLPSEMGKMDNLVVLKIDNNKLEGSLIGEIRKMPLRVLDVSDNNMTGMPAEIGQLNKLETLDYSNNNIDTLPNEVKNLTQLKEFNLTGNPIPSSRIEQLRSELPNTVIIF
jgi:Leucine-rich repeat (LRR) protein